MIIPSIDIMDGQAVQLIGGREKALDAGDPAPLADGFRVAGEIAVIDLDAAIGTGDNRASIEKLLRTAACRVGGGIRSREAAVRWLDAGAAKIIIGTKAVPELLRELPKERLIAALDAEHGEVVVEGWRKKTGAAVLDRIRELREYVGGFLVTFVEKEGRLGGTNLDQVAELVQAADGARVTIAGGVSSPEEIAELDRLHADAQVGMAIYTGRMHLADAIAAPLASDRSDGLWPTLVCDELGTALGLAWSDRSSLRKAVETRKGVYHSRKRGLWIKGETSGATQELLRIDLDCDRDTLRFIVRQNGGGFCHLPQFTCFGKDNSINGLFRLLERRKDGSPEESYSGKLFKDPRLLSAKLLEEARELGEAQEHQAEGGPGAREEVIWEAADLIFFTFSAMVRSGVSLAEVEAELGRRSLRLTRKEVKAPKKEAAS